MTTSQAAAELGISESRVRRIAAKRGLGSRIGRRLLVFTAADLDAMRVRKPGRPRSTPAPAAGEGGDGR